MVSLLAGLFAAACIWVAARAALGGSSLEQIPPRLFGAKHLRGTGPGFQVWLSQAGAAVTPAQFCAVSAGVGAATFLVLLAVLRTPVVATAPALAASAAPYAYWASQRRKQAAARSSAWPDALRYLVGVLGAGIATLHEALEQLSKSGPEPLRGPMGRYVRLAGRLGALQALETVRAELADPISDPVLLAFGGAVEEGTDTALRVLSDLGSQITADIQLAEKVRTLQTQSRMATWGCFAMPYAVLMFLCATNVEYRHFFSQAVGLVVVLLGACLSLLGLLASRRLVRPIATSTRVFAAGAPQ
ncbi:MAG TPA: hypothetical protein VME20_12345 [Acidimicrobiales bacterium]|nr:hypothetical protein [Acidimicrobiales bacterium]